MPCNRQGRDEPGKKTIAEDDESAEAASAEAAREDATDIVCDLLASAEEAALRGQYACAASLACQAERAALQTGIYSLISLVWRHAPTYPPFPPPTTGRGSQ